VSQRVALSDVFPDKLSTELCIKNIVKFDHANEPYVGGSRYEVIEEVDANTHRLPEVYNVAFHLWSNDVFAEFWYNRICSINHGSHAFFDLYIRRYLIDDDWCLSVIVETKRQEQIDMFWPCAARMIIDSHLSKLKTEIMVADFLKNESFFRRYQRISGFFGGIGGFS